MEDGSATNSENRVVRGNDTAWILAAVFGVVFLLLTYFGTWFFCLRVVPSFKSEFLELGENPVSDDPDHYLTGLSFMHRGTVVDASQVDIYTVGDYEVNVYNGQNSYTYEIHVCDTTAPEIKIPYGKSFLGADADIADIENDNDSVSLYELNYPYMLYDLAEMIYDGSGGYEAELFIDDALISEDCLNIPTGYHGESYGEQIIRLKESCDASQNIVLFPEQKTYKISLVVTDGSDNVTKKDFTVKVKDSLPPQIVGYEGEDSPYFATDRLYSVEDLVESVTDNSEFFSTAFIDGDDTLARISFETVGEHSFTVYAVDEAGNECSYDLSAKFDEAPVFVGVRDRHVMVGSEYDRAKHIIAVDNTDGNVSQSIVLDDGGFDPNKKGTYEVRYTAADSHGLETQIVSELTVDEMGESDFYLTDEERDLLCEYSYFDYDILDEYDFVKTVELVEPTLVNMIYRFGYNGHNAGSGFIYKINSDYIYVVSCAHVMAGMDGEMEVMFSDKDASTIYIDSPEYEQLSPENEIAMFRFPTSMVPADTLVELREIYCDENIYDILVPGEELIAYSGHWMNEEPMVRKLYIIDLDSKFIDDAVNCVRTSHNVESGMSGTAVVDECGRLVGIVEGYMTFWDNSISDYKREGYQLRIDKLDDLYKRVSGE